jgi:hypothetical protein
MAMKTYRCIAEQENTITYEHPSNGKIAYSGSISRVEIEWSLPNDLDIEKFKTTESMWSEYDYEICDGGGEDENWDFSSASNEEELERALEEEDDFEDYLDESGWIQTDDEQRIIGPLMEDSC